MQAMESNAALRLELERASGDLEELVGVCNLMDEQLREASRVREKAMSDRMLQSGMGGGEAQLDSSSQPRHAAIQSIDHLQIFQKDLKQLREVATCPFTVHPRTCSPKRAL